MNKYFLLVITSKNLSVATSQPLLIHLSPMSSSWVSLCSEHAHVSSILKIQMLQPKLLLSFWFLSSICSQAFWKVSLLMWHTIFICFDSISLHVSQGLITLKGPYAFHVAKSTGHFSLSIFFSLVSDSLYNISWFWFFLGNFLAVSSHIPPLLWPS